MIYCIDDIIGGLQFHTLAGPQMITQLEKVGTNLHGYGRDWFVLKGRSLYKWQSRSQMLFSWGSNQGIAADFVEINLFRIDF